MANSIVYRGRTYADDEIVSGNLSRKQSLSLADLSLDTFDITLRPWAHFGFFTHDPYLFKTSEGLWFETSEHDPLAESVQQNTPLYEYLDGAQIAIWYLQSKERVGENIYQISAYSTLGLLNQRKHYGGYYDGSSDSSKAISIITDICGAGFPFTLQANLQTTKLKGWLPIASARDNLQQVLLALGANVRVDNNGYLNIGNLANSAEYQITSDAIMLSNASVKDDTPVTSVVVVSHEYIPASTATTLYESSAVTTEQTIMFDDPVDVTTLSASGYTILASGANYVTLSSGQGTLTGKQYQHITREVSVVVNSAPIENVIRVENATMISVTDAITIANTLADFYKQRKTINAVVSGMAVRAGDVVNIYDPWNKVMTLATIAESKITLSKTISAAVSALANFIPHQTQSYEYHKDVLTAASGTWTVPAGVTDITVILIGGGSGGSGGNKGFHGQYSGEVLAGKIYDAENIEHSSIYGVSGTPGAGGAGGAGGSGGKYVVATGILVSAGDVFNFECGQGGAGGAGGSGYNSGTPGDAGVPGGNTRFYNSYFSADTANGTVDQNGYTDSDGTIYGGNGIGGYSGASGGVAGNANLQFAGCDGSAGQGTMGYAGGSGANYGYSRNSFGGNYDLWYPNDKLVVAGGGGGGAAYGNNGTSATQPQFSIISAHLQYSVISTPGNGGAGGNASAPSATLYGRGGNGGHGGGGGGAPGGLIYNQTAGGVPNPNSSFTSIIVLGTGGNGGNGSAGTAGCVIVKYRLPV